MMNSNFKMMITTGFLIVVFLFLFKYQTPEKAMGRTVATINDTEISYAEFKIFLQKAYPEKQEFSQLDRRFALDQLINQKIILEYAKEKTDVEKLLEKEFAARYENRYRNLLVKYLYKIKFENADVDMKEIKKYFNDNDFISLYYFEFPVNKIDNKIEVYKTLSYLKKNKGKKIIDSIKHNKNINNPKFMGYFKKNNLPEEYRNYTKNLTKENSFTSPINTDYGFLIFFRGNNPSFKELKQNLYVEFKEQKSEDKRDEFTKFITDNTKMNMLFIKKLATTKHITKKTKQEIVAKIKDVYSLTFGEFHDAMQNLYGKNYAMTDFITFKENSRNLIISKVIFHYAIEEEIHKNKRFVIKWKAMQTQIEDINNSRIVEYIIDNNIREDKSLSTNELKAYYIKHRHEYQKPTLYKLRKLVFKKKNKADEVFQKYQSGESIDRLAKRYSEEKYAKITAGIMPYITEDKLNGNGYILKKINIGEVYPPVKDGKNYIIYELIDKQIGAIPSFNVIGSDIEKGLFKEKIEEWITEKIELEKYKIEKYYDELGAIN